MDILHCFRQAFMSHIGPQAGQFRWQRVAPVDPTHQSGRSKPVPEVICSDIGHFFTVGICGFPGIFQIIVNPPGCQCASIPGREKNIHLTFRKFSVFHYTMMRVSSYHLTLQRAYPFFVWSGRSGFRPFSNLCFLFCVHGLPAVLIRRYR